MASARRMRFRAGAGRALTGAALLVLGACVHRFRDGGASVPPISGVHPAGPGGATYDEPGRPQFHFTASVGWINDVNGVWFQDGLYHLAFQADPLDLDGSAPKCWGHAVSRDLVHWQELPTMLAADGLVPGAVWSGSTVVDGDDTAGLRTGATPALVTLYTATGTGTALVHSEDAGATWSALPREPVAVGTHDNGAARDPHVLWYAPTRRWVCALWERGRGTAIYTSPDLRTWTFASSVPFGFECPDLFELPVEGDPGWSRWVLSDASGRYLLGDFDGRAFHPDPEEPRRLDRSDDPYAGQVFFRGTFPDERRVRMAWLRSPVGATAPWSQSLTFPTELALRAFPGGLRIAQRPVREIEGLYASDSHLGGRTVAPGVEALPGLSGDAFDLALVLDLDHSEAATCTLRLADATVTLDLAHRTAFGAPFTAPGGELSVRVLRDRAEYEVFVDDGEVVYSRAWAFPADDRSVSLTADGTLRLRSADLHALARIWPGRPAQASRLVDDRDPATRYEGSWTPYQERRYLAGTCSVARRAGDAFEVRFRGTRVDWYGLRNTDLGEADVFLDGEQAAAGIDLWSPVRRNARLFRAVGLPDGEHVLRVVATGARNPRSSGAALVHDYLLTYVDA